MEMSELGIHITNSEAQIFVLVMTGIYVIYWFYVLLGRMVNHPYPVILG